MQQPFRGVHGIVDWQIIVTSHSSPLFFGVRNAESFFLAKNVEIINFHIAIFILQMYHIH